MKEKKVFYIYRTKTSFNKYLKSKLDFEVSTKGIGYCYSLPVVGKIFIITTDDLSFRVFNQNTARPGIIKLIKRIEIEKTNKKKKDKNPYHALQEERGDHYIIYYYAQRLYEETKFL